MAAFVREFLQITKESAFGVKMTSPVRGTDQIVIRLPGANQFSMRADPEPVDIPYGGGYAVTADTVSDKIACKGRLQTPLTYSQAPILLALGLSRINTGQTSPWTTTEPAKDLASVTVEHAIWEDDAATYKRTAYPGVKCSDGKVEVSAQSQYAMLDLGLIGSSYQGNPFDSSTDPDGTVFPVPADNEYPTDWVHFIDSAGALTLGGGLFAQYESLSIGWTNKVDMRHYASRFVQKIRCYGRELNFDADVTLLASPDLRGSYQQLAALRAQVVFTGPSSHAITFDLKANGRLKSVQDDLQLEKLYGRKISLMSRYDRTAGTDAAITIA